MTLPLTLIEFRSFHHPNSEGHNDTPTTLLNLIPFKAPLIKLPVY